MWCFGWPEVVVLTRIWECRLVTNGTVDESIFKIAQQKLVLDAAVLEGGDSSSEHNDGDARTMGEILSALLAVPPPSWGSRLRKALHYTDLKLSQGKFFWCRLITWKHSFAPTICSVQTMILTDFLFIYCKLIHIRNLVLNWHVYGHSLSCTIVFDSTLSIVQICSLLQTEVETWQVELFIFYHRTTSLVDILILIILIYPAGVSVWDHLHCVGDVQYEADLQDCSSPSRARPKTFFITVYLLGVHSLCLFAGTGLTTWGGLSWNLWMPCISPRFILCHVPVVQQVFQFKVSCGTWNLSNLNVLNSWRSREPRAFGHLCINLWT